MLLHRLKTFCRIKKNSSVATLAQTLLIIGEKMPLQLGQRYQLKEKCLLNSFQTLRLSHIFHLFKLHET